MKIYNNKILFKILGIFLILVSYNFGYAQETSLSYKMKQVLNYMDNYYVDTVNQDEIVEKAIKEMLKQLDPHSIYISKEDVKRMSQPLEGSFEGIGIQFNVLNDTIIIVSTISGGPSEKLGIRAGDRIIKIEGENVANIGITTSGVRERLLGEKGTEVKISIHRRGERKLINYKIKRAKIPIFSVDASYMATDEIGYIKVNRFAATTIKEFNNALKTLKKQGADDIILDLRDNGGGYLSTAIDLCDEFLSKGKLIVYTEGEKSSRTEYKATSRGNFEKGKLVVIIDEGSASASEILSGAIQDWDRGVIVGRRSFGKGLVQRPFSLIDGSMIRLTIARYYTPTGRLIQKPYEEGVDAYRKDIMKRFKHGELNSKDSIHFPDSLKFYTLRKQRIVYGGGGIMPDYFVPLDTASLPDFYQSWIQKGIINSFILTYVDNNRQKLLKLYPNIDQFSKKFSITKDIYNQLFDYAKKELKKINPDEEIAFDYTIDSFEDSKAKVSTQLKALVARDLWDISEYYQVMNKINPAYLKAIEVLQKSHLYEAHLK